MQQGQEIEHDVLVVCDEHLVGVQVDAVFLQVHLLLQLGEVQDACQVEGEVDVEVDVEQQVLEVHGVEVPVEFGVVLVLEVRGFLVNGLGFVDHKGDVDTDFLDVAFIVLGALGVVHVLGLGALDNFHRHELAVGVQDLTNAFLCQVFLGVFRDVRHNVCAP